MGLFSNTMNKLFGTHSQREVKSITPIVDRIEALGDTYKAMSEAELKSQTDVLKGRLQKGESLDDILPDAFAVIREAADRVLGLRPYRVQLIGGIILHQGRIAEMKTGEGKTLVEILPAYLNALTGNGVHIVTVNDYLAKRDSVGGTDVASQSLTYGEVIEEPAPPTREGYTFGGWYSDNALNDPWDFGTQVAGDTELYAKWIPDS